MHVDYFLVSQVEKFNPLQNHKVANDLFIYTEGIKQQQLKMARNAEKRLRQFVLSKNLEKYKNLEYATR